MIRKECDSINMMDGLILIFAQYYINCLPGGTHEAEMCADTARK
jgi:hypothetical protein